MICKPDPRALEVAVGLGSQMDGKKRRKAVTVCHRMLWALCDL